MTRRPRRLNDLRRSEEGGTMAEHSIMLALIAMAGMAAVMTFGTSVAGLFQRAVAGFGH